MASQLKDTEWLEWIASLVGAGPRQTHSASLPPDRFYCLLDELPLHLIPRRQLRSQWQDVSRQQLFLNPQCSVLPAGQVPADLELQRCLLDKFNLQGTVAWVRDPAIRSLHPFWLGPRLEAILSRLPSGEPVPASVPTDARLLLARAGILTPEAQGERRLAEWAELVRRGAGQFREKGYVPLANLIHPFNVAATTGTRSGKEPFDSAMSRVHGATRPTMRVWRGSSTTKLRMRSAPSWEKRSSLPMFISRLTWAAPN